jgi:hypothetical protein
LRCRCTTCELEKVLLDELREQRHIHSYRQLASRSAILSAFQSTQLLLQGLSELRKSDSQIRFCDQLIGELLRLRADGNRETINQLVLLILMPAMHQTARKIAAGFRSLAREEIAQHLVMTLLEIVESETLLRERSHFAFRITRLLRRRLFCWALHESQDAARGDSTVLTDADPDRRANFESEVFLREFFQRCLRDGWLTPAELVSLMLFKIEGVRAEVLAAQAGISEIAFRHRTQRLVERLRRFARSPSPIAQRKSASAIAVVKAETFARGAAA